MSLHIAKEIHLVSRPQGTPTHENFKLVETAFEYNLDQQIAINKGSVPAATAAASASYTGSINAIKALP